MLALSRARRQSHKLGLVRLARTSGLNKDLLAALQDDGSLRASHQYFGAVSINDVCDFGTDIAEVLGTAVISADDKQKCRRACAAADQAMRSSADTFQRQACPYTFHDVADQQGACLHNTQATCEFTAAGWLGSGNTCNLVTA